MPRSNTVCEPRGMPASARRAQAWYDSGAAFVRMGEVQAHPQGMVLPQHAAQFPGDPLGEHGGHFRADSDELDMRNRTQVREDPVELVVAHEERIAAGNQHVADFRMVAEILESLRQAGLVGDDVALAHDPRTGAIAAIAGAEIEGQEQHAVRIAMDHSGGSAVVILAQRVGRFAPGLRKFTGGGDDRPPQGLLGIVRRNQAHVVGGGGDGQDFSGPVEPFPLVFGQVEHFFELLAGPDAAAGMPSPVVPLLVGNVAVKCLAKGPGTRRSTGGAGDGGASGSFSATMGRWCPRFRESQRPETLLNRQGGTVTRVALAWTTGRLLIDFHPGNRRWGDIEITHSEKTP